MRRKRKIVYLAGFLFSIPVALTSYINSSLLEGFINPYLVSLVYILASVLTVFGLLEMPKVLTKRGNKFALISSSLIAAISFILMGISQNGILIVASFIVSFISINFVYASLDIFIEDMSGRAKVGKLRGLYLTIINSSWVIAQMVSGSIISKNSFEGIYMLSALFTFLVPMVIALFLEDFKDPIYKKIPIRKTIAFFIRNRDISIIYTLNLILNFFFAWMVIYTPIYLNEYIGFAWEKIGIIFTIMLTPFVLLEYPLGKFSDKIGEKKMLRIGFMIAALATISLAFVSMKSAVIFALILFSTRVGAATVEVMSESYFFKLVDEENVEAISFFRNTRAVSYIIAPLVAIVVLSVAPYFRSIFVVLSLILFGGFLLANRIKDIK